MSEFPMLKPGDMLRVKAGHLVRWLCDGDLTARVAVAVRNIGSNDILLVMSTAQGPSFHTTGVVVRSFSTGDTLFKTGFSAEEAAAMDWFLTEEK